MIYRKNVHDFEHCLIHCYLFLKKESNELGNVVAFIYIYMKICMYKYHQTVCCNKTHHLQKFEAHLGFVKKRKKEKKITIQQKPNTTPI